MMKKLFTLICFLALSTATYAQGLATWGNRPITGSAFPAGVNFASASQPLFANASVTLGPAAPWTMNIWFKGTSWPTGATILQSTGNSFAGGYYFYNNSLTNSMPLTFAPRPAGNTTTCPATAGIACERIANVTDGGLHMITGSWDGTVAKLYVDGILKDTSTSGGTYAANTSPGYWILGGANSAYTLYDYRVYTSSLAANDVYYLWLLGNAGFIPSSGPLSTGMAVYLPLNNCYPTCTDSTGNGNTFATDTSAPTLAITVPSNGGTISGSSVTITATCSDTIACLTVQILVDGTPTGGVLTTSPYTITYDSTVLVDGSHTIGCNGTNAGNVVGTCSNITVTSNNSVTAKNYYFANAGSDSNNCLSTGAACQTINKLNTVATYHGGDTINLNGGDNFNDVCVALTNTNVKGTHANPVVMQSYGTGNATITANCSSGNNRVAGIGLVNVTGLTIQNLTIRGNSGAGANCGISITQSSNSNSSDSIVISAVDIGGFWSTSGQLGAGNFCGDIWLQGFPGLPASGAASGGITQAKVVNSTIHGLSGATSLDDAGINGFGNGKNIIGPVYQGNTISNIGGHNGGNYGQGILMDGVSGGNSEFNVVHNNGANNNNCPGPVGIYAFSADNVKLNFNEVYHQETSGLANVGCDNGGMDLDGSVTNSQERYNYTHDNFEYGLQFFIQGTWGPNDMAWNISSDDATTQGEHIQVNNMNGTTTWNIFNNTIYSDASNGTNAHPLEAIGWFNTCNAASALFANNAVVVTNQDTTGFSRTFVVGFGGNGSGCPSSVVFKSNGWYTPSGNALWKINGQGTASSLATWQTLVAGNGGDTNALSSNPSFSGTVGSGINCNSTSGPQPCPSGFSLGGGSPYKNVGTDLTGVPYNIVMGTRDYFGNTVPTGTGTGYPIGASN